MLQETSNLQAVDNDDHHDTAIEAVNHDHPVKDEASFGGRLMDGVSAGVEGGVVAGAFVLGLVGTVYGVAQAGKGIGKASKGIGNWWANRRKAKALQAQAAKAKKPAPQPAPQAKAPVTPELVKTEQTS